MKIAEKFCFSAIFIIVLINLIGLICFVSPFGVVLSLLLQIPQGSGHRSRRTYGGPLPDTSGL